MQMLLYDYGDYSFPGMTLKVDGFRRRRWSKDALNHRCRPFPLHKYRALTANVQRLCIRDFLTDVHNRLESALGGTHHEPSRVDVASVLPESHVAERNGTTSWEVMATFCPGNDGNGGHIRIEKVRGAPDHKVHLQQRRFPWVLRFS